MTFKQLAIQSLANILLGSGVFDRIKAVVKRVNDPSLSGAAKREAALTEIKAIGLLLEKHLANLAIELAVAWLKSAAK